MQQLHHKAEQAALAGMARKPCLGDRDDSGQVGRGARRARDFCCAASSQANVLLSLCV